MEPGRDGFGLCAGVSARTGTVLGGWFLFLKKSGNYTAGLFTFGFLYGMIYAISGYDPAKGGISVWAAA